MDTYTEFLFLGKIVIAACLGGSVGIEREFAEKPAGLRTHMLVCATSSFLVMLAILMVVSAQRTTSTENPRLQVGETPD